MTLLGRWTALIPIGMLLIATGCSGSEASTSSSAPAVASSSAPAGGAEGIDVTLEQMGDHALRDDRAGRVGDLHGHQPGDDPA